MTAPICTFPLADGHPCGAAHPCRVHYVSAPLEPLDSAEALDALEDVHAHLADSVFLELRAAKESGASAEERRAIEARWDRLLTQLAKVMDDLRRRP